MSKVEIQDSGRRLLAEINVVDDTTTPLELGLSLEAFEQVGLGDGRLASLAQAAPAQSFGAWRRQLLML